LEIVQEDLHTAETDLIQFQITNKIGSLSNAIDNQYKLVGSLQLQGDLAKAKGDTLQAQAIDQIILEREAEFQNLVGISAEYNNLNDHVAQTRSTYEFLLNRRVEARIKESQILEVGYVQIITPAKPPQKPVTAISSKVIVLGAVVSVLAGILLTFLLEYLKISGTFRSFQMHPPEFSQAVSMSE
jgi:uncharacterized protein involved in exopolysaccharide biosynthesis